MKGWDCITKENRQRIAKRYKERFGIEFIPPSSDKPTIHIEPKIESLEEVDKLMRKPGRGAWRG